jgi:D-amino-acid dehydrogenase
MDPGSAAVSTVPAGLRVVIVGAGIVGACCALTLARHGHRVTLVDPEEPGGEQASSFGNGGWISPASVVPMSTPGLWKRVPALLADADGPLTIRPRALPGLAPWLARFVHSGSTLERVQRTASTLAVLLRDAPARHSALAHSAGLRTLIHRQGLLYAYRTAADLQGDAFAWQLRRDKGIVWERWGRLPDAGSSGTDVADASRWPRWLHRDYGTGVWVPAGAHCSDPGVYTAGLVNAAERLGVQRVRATALGWVRSADGRLVGVQVQATVLPADRAVLAAGIASAPLARALGSAIPLASERGYHVVLPWSAAWPSDDTGLPVMPGDGRMAVTFTPQGLRLAGQVELAAASDPPAWRRADVLWRHARRLLTDAAWAATGLADRRLDDTRPPGVTAWMGHRPSTPDGLPAIGPAAGCTDVVLAFGHGHVGLASAPITAEWVADIVSTGEVRTNRSAAAACSPGRFA